MLNQVNTPGPVPPSARTKETRPVRLATITTAQGPRLHVRGRSGYIDVAGGTGDPRMSELAYVLAAGEPAMSTIHRLESQDGREVAPADFAAAVPAPPRILCLGLNYSEHALEGGRAVPSWPDAFVRGADSVLGPYADLVKPALTSRFDYEAELGVVIGRAAATSAPRTRWMPSPALWCSTTRPAATGSGPAPSGRPARTSRAACRSAPRW